VSAGLDFDDAELGALVRRADLVDRAVGVRVVAEVERAQQLVRVMHLRVVSLVRQQHQPALREAVVKTITSAQRISTKGRIAPALVTLTADESILKTALSP